MKRRNLFAMLILLYVLEIFYLFYWICDVQNGIRYYIKKSNIGGGLTVFLMIITLGLYGFIWQWNTCKHLKSICGKDKRIITLVFSVLLIGIVINPLIIQSSINSMNTLMVRY